MLAPHDREDAELGVARLAAEDLQQPLVFARRQPVLGDDLGRDLETALGFGIHARRFSCLGRFWGTDACAYSDRVWCCRLLGARTAPRRRLHRRVCNAGDDAAQILGVQCGCADMRRDGSLTDSPRIEASGVLGKVGRWRACARPRELPGRVGRGAYPRQLSAVRLAVLQCNNPYFPRGVRRLTLLLSCRRALPPVPNPPAWTSTLQQKELEHVRDFQGRHRCRHACRVHLDRGEQCRVGAVQDLQAAARHQPARRLQARRRLLPGRRAASAS